MLQFPLIVEYCHHIWFLWETFKVYEINLGEDTKNKDFFTVGEYY